MPHFLFLAHNSPKKLVSFLSGALPRQNVLSD